MQTQYLHPIYSKCSQFRRKSGVCAWRLQSTKRHWQFSHKYATILGYFLYLTRHKYLVYTWFISIVTTQPVLCGTCHELSATKHQRYIIIINIGVDLTGILGGRMAGLTIKVLL